MSYLHLESASLRHWQSVLDGPHPPRDLPRALRRCWQRSMAHEINPEGPEQEPIVTHPVLTEKRGPLEPVLQAFPSILENVVATLSKQHFKLLFADTEGVVVDEWGGGHFADPARDIRLIPGSSWHENVRGTNAIGTALAEQVPVAVEGRAHFMRPHHHLVCYASPVFDPQGQLLGVLDATSFISHADHDLLATVSSAARALEDFLRQHILSQQGIQYQKLLERLLGRYPEPAFVVEPTGLLRMANGAAIKAFSLLRMVAPSSHPALFHVHAQLTDILGCTWSELTDPENQQLHLEHDPQTRFRVDVEPLSDPPYVAAVVFLERLSSPRPHASPQLPEPQRDAAFGAMLGDDPGFVEVLDKAQRLAVSSLPLLLCSETGTGKELLARAIHDASPRAQGPFVALNCAALSPQLLESELFGHAPGAFTGAHPKGKDGHIAMAKGGTLFLDEIAETPPSFQALLLRFLEDGSYYQVGGTQSHKADVRILCATCKDLQVEVEEQRFRHDLYYRIRGATLSLPALREREDLDAFFQAMLQRLSEELTLAETPTLSEESSALLSQHPWPGNVRELRHALQCAIALAQPTPLLEPEHFPDIVAETPPQSLVEAKTSSLSQLKTITDSKVAAVKQALEKAQGNVSEAARSLGVARSTIYRLLRRHKE